MKNYASLKELTFFSFSVYFGLAVIAFSLLHDLLDDFFGIDLIAIGWIIAIPGLLISFIAALIYSGTQLPVIGWNSFLPLEANLVIGGCVFIILSNGLSSKLELNLKWSGYSEIVRQVEQGRFKGNGRHALPATYRYLTRFAGQPRDIIVNRKKRVTYVFFPLEDLFPWDKNGIAYRSDNEYLSETDFTSDIPTYRVPGDKICGHWFYYTYDIPD